ncbi:MAG: cyclophilin-like family protein [Pseudomonadota bacterium]
MRQVKITVGRVAITARLLDTPTAEALWAAAPFESRAAVWGEEVYFPAPFLVDREAEARDVLQPGEIAFRHDGGAVILAFGPTPVSRGDEIRTASPANVFAVAEDDLKALRDTEAGDLVTVQRGE